MSLNYKCHQIPALKDNYIYAVENLITKEVIVVDPGEARVVVDFLDEYKLNLKSIFVTHHHWDHVDGINDLVAKYDSVEVIANKKDEGRIPALTKTINQAESFEKIGLEWHVIACPGHTLNHIAFHNKKLDWLFSGDTLFSLGCGRLFEGTAEQMYQSLESIKKFSLETIVFSSHEYTLANVNFSLGVLKDSQKLNKLKEEAEYKRSNGLATVPTKLKFEIENNLFLKTQDPELKASLKMSNAKGLEVFFELRRLRDLF